MEDRPNWLSGRRPTSLSGAFARTTSSDSGSSLGSPSPAAKPRWNTDYAGKLHTRASSEDLTEDENTKPSSTRPRLSPNSRRLRNQELMKRALAAPPLFVNRGQREKPTFAAANRARREMGARIEQTTKELARKSSMSSMGSKASLNDDDQPLPPPNVPKSWGSRAKKQPHWVQKILSPDLPGATQEEMDVLFQKPHPPPYNNPPAHTADNGSRELTPPASRPASVQPRYVDDKASAQQQYTENDYFTGSAASVRSDQPEYVDEDSFSNTSAASVRSQQPQDADNDYFTRSLADVESQYAQNTVPPASDRYQPQYDEDAPTSPNDDQFTSRSIEVSQSPAIRIRTTLLDEIREREIETLTARAVATNRLGEIRERNSEERDASPASVRRFSKSPTPALSKVTVPDSPKEATEELAYDPNYRTILEEDGYPIAGTPVWVMSEEAYQKKTGCGPYVPDPEGTYQTLRQLAKVLSPRNSPAEQKVEEDNDATEKIGQQIGDIEKLPESVEVVSEAIEASEGGLAEKKHTAEQPVELRNKLLDVEGSTKRHSTGSSDIDPEDRIAAEAKLFELQDNKSERNSWSAPSRSQSVSPTDDVEETPKPAKVDPMCLPTPRVTGAYIETPAPSERKPRKRQPSSSRETVNRAETVYSTGDLSGSEESVTSRTSSSQRTALEATRRSRFATSRRSSDATRISRSSSQRSSDSESRQRTDSPHPESTRKPNIPLINTATIYSAAEDVRQLELAAGLEDSGLDDTTLDEFAAMMEQNPTSPSAIDRIDSLIYDEAGFPLSPKQRAQKLEMLHYERMSKRLYNTSSGIRQTRKGITRITNTLTTLPDPKPQPAIKPVIEAPGHPITENAALEIKAPRSTKVKFGIESEVVDVDFKFDIKWTNLFWQDTEQFSTQGQHRSYRNSKRKFTWIGFICFMFLLSVAWFIAESATCSIFCRPKYASGNKWNYEDPSFPFAIPTKLDQWTGSIVSTGLTNTYDYIGGLAGKTGRGGTDDILEAGTFDDDEIYD